MGMLLKILSWFYFIYPVKVFIRKRVVDYFLHYHVRNILKSAQRKYSYSDNVLLLELINKRAFRGTVCEYFRASDFSPTAKDIAIAINISSNAYCREESSDTDKIMDLSYHLSRQFKEVIVLDHVLKTIFLELNKSLDDLDVNVPRAEIENAFSSKKSLFIQYFNSFDNPNFHYGIKIWHESEDDDWIKWSEIDSITIHLDPLRIREGFFLVGFDYSTLNSGERLTVASSKNGYEYFNSLESKNVVWAR